MRGEGKSIRKLLIANRGEIAVRIIRSCREMGIKTVAVFSECDRLATHVQWADEAYPLGPSPATQSYLNRDRILDICHKTKVDAIHPGYGFLSEDPVFARTCENQGILWVGPHWNSVKKIGNKIEARLTAREIQLPLIPGMDRPVQSLEETRKITARLGYPIFLKARSGGGGKGLQLVSSPQELESAYQLACTEAKESFDDPVLYVEKYMGNAHHIEVQILGDDFGNVVALGERECSVQRRHQKIIEESPSPFLKEDTRHKLFEAAVSLGRAIGYKSAGTVEFLVDQNQDFYFLEVNPRLQVEHPVTEQRINHDLVRLQLEVAMGKPLDASLTSAVKLNGHAIECRIYAEDPDNNFIPCPGQISRVRHPEGPFLRIDSAIYPGDEIPIFYDPMISKLITWGRDRKEAVIRMKRALNEYQLVGVKTNIPFLSSVFETEEFTQGNYDLTFLDENMTRLKNKTHEDHKELAALAVFLLVEEQRSPRGFMPHPLNGQGGTDLWKLTARRELLR